MRPIFKKVPTIVFLFTTILLYSFTIKIETACANEPAGQKIKQSNALIFLNSTSIKEMNKEIAILKKEGVKPYHIFPPDRIIGYIPESSDSRIKKMSSVNEIRRSTTGMRSLAPSKSSKQNVAEKIWERNYVDYKINKNQTSQNEDAEISCAGAIYPPETVKPKTKKKKSFKELPHGATFDETSEFLAGSVIIGVILPESDGHTEDWTDEEIDDAMSVVQKGMEIWISAVPEKSDLSFVYEFHTKVPISEEPEASLSSGFTNGYKVMNALGYTGSHSSFLSYQTRQFDNDLRNKYETDWAVTLFMLDISNSPNKSSFSYYGGPYLVVHYKRTGHERLVAHEFAHSFYALDEYNGLESPNCNERSGYLNVKNENRDECGKNEGCIMRSTSLTGICQYTRGQLGILDSDGDRIPDILDTFPSVSISSLAPSTKPSVSIDGSAMVTMLTNSNPYGTWHDMTTKTLSSVEYRIDKGSWISAESSDGTFDEYSEGFRVRSPKLSNDSHTVEIRAVDSVGNKTEIPISKTITINADETRLYIEPLGLSFTYETGGTLPTSQNLYIKFNNGEGLNWEVNSHDEFIILDKTSGEDNSTISVNVDVTGKDEGSYSGEIEISSSDIENSKLTIPVNLIITSAPDISIDTEKIEIWAQIYDSSKPLTLSPGYNAIGIKSKGMDHVKWDSVISVPWLKLFPSSATAPSTTLLMIDILNLSKGKYETNVEFKPTDGNYASHYLPVKLELCDISAVTDVTPTTIKSGELVTINGTDFGDIQGESLLRLKLTDQLAITVTPESWSDTEITFIMPNISGTGRVWVKTACGVGQSSDLLTITSTELKPAKIGLDKDEIELTLNSGDSMISETTLAISNLGEEPLTWTISADVEWISFDASNGIGNSDVAVSCDLNGFDTGIYTATITVSAPDADNSPQTLPITITVLPEQTLISILEISPSSAKFNKELTILGQGFGEGIGGKVFFDSIEAEILSWKDNEIKIMVPWGATPGNIFVKVKTSDGESNEMKCKFTNPFPKINSIKPSRATTGSQIAVKGKNFGEEQGKIIFGKKKIPVLNWSNNNVSFEVPSILFKSYKKKLYVKVKTIYGKSKRKRFTILK